VEQQPPIFYLVSVVMLFKCGVALIADQERSIRVVKPGLKILKGLKHCDSLPEHPNSEFCRE
jgi:hypothetical protein